MHYFITFTLNLNQWESQSFSENSPNFTPFWNSVHPSQIWSISISVKSENGIHWTFTGSQNLSDSDLEWSSACLWIFSKSVFPKSVFIVYSVSFRLTRERASDKQYDRLYKNIALWLSYFQTVSDTLIYPSVSLSSLWFRSLCSKFRKKIPCFSLGLGQDRYKAPSVWNLMGDRKSHLMRLCDMFKLQTHSPRNEKGGFYVSTRAGKPCEVWGFLDYAWSVRPLSKARSRVNIFLPPPVANRILKSQQNAFYSKHPRF